MRAIDADALMAKLGIGQDCSICKHDDTPYCCWKPDVVDVCEAICDAPTIEPEPHWIPCSHELPDTREFTSKTVLCCDKYGGIYTATYNKLGEWHDDAEYADLTDVIAWMPLPECYQEDI